MSKKSIIFKRVLSSLILISLCLSITVYGASSYPAPTSDKYINDYIDMVDDSIKNQIISIGDELENKTSAQAVIVVINSTNKIPIEDYANKLFRTWGIGTSEKDNGLLLLLAIEDKEWRVEVGRGLEGALPDLLTNSIMENNAKPYFIEGKYDQGLLESYSIFADHIATEYNVTLEKTSNILHTSPNKTSRNSGIMAGGIFIFIILFDVIFNRGRLLSFILQILFWNNLSGRGGPRGGGGGYGGGGYGGFGGGSSNGGGSSGSW